MIYKANGKKRPFFVVVVVVVLFFVCLFFVLFFVVFSVANKSQYRDTHSEDTIGNVRDTDYVHFVWSC